MSVFYVRMRTRAEWVEGLSKKKRGKRKPYGHGQQCGDFRGAVEESMGGMHGDGHTTQCHTDDVPWACGPETCNFVNQRHSVNSIKREKNVEREITG